MTDKLSPIVVHRPIADPNDKTLGLTNSLVFLARTVKDMAGRRASVSFTLARVRFGDHKGLFRPDIIGPM